MSSEEKKIQKSCDRLVAIFYSHEEFKDEKLFEVVETFINENKTSPSLFLNKFSTHKTPTNSHETPLMAAIRHTNNVEMVKVLIEKGADLSCQDNIGRSALSAAVTSMTSLSDEKAQRDRMEIFTLLLSRMKREKKNDASVFSDCFFMALFTAIMNKNLPVVQMLIEHGACVDLEPRRVAAFRFSSR
jgi:hypothetical protein